jgi:lia operon protein LiaG
MRRLPLLVFLLSELFVNQACINVNAQRILAEASFSIENVKSLEIEGGFCNVNLNGYTGKSLKMEGNITGNGDHDKYEIIYQEDNGRIKVWVEHPVNFWGNIQGKLIFDVPREVLVHANCSSGNIEAGELDTGEIDLEASSGNISVKEMSGILSLRCSSGNITLNGHQGNTTARTSSGNLKIENVNGNLTSHASSGNMQIFNIAGDVKADCSSGNIRLRDIEGTLDIESSSGNIRGEGILLKANSRFKASSGNITIGLLNDENDLSFDLDAGSGSLFANGSSADDRLILKKGPIQVSGVTTSGNQHYKAE